MSKSTCPVVTVYSSMDDTGAMAVVEDSSSPYFHHTDSLDSSAFQTAPALKPLPPSPSTQAMSIYRSQRTAPSPATPRVCQPQLIATISAGFEKGDYLIREERESNIYFDFFEEAYNFACEKGYARMPKNEETDYMEVIKRAHRSVPGGCRYNTGRLLMVLRKRLVPVRVPIEEEEPLRLIMDEEGSTESSPKKIKNKKLLGRSMNTLPTDSESSRRSTTYHSSSASTSYVDSWE